MNDTLKQLRAIQHQQPVYCSRCGQEANPGTPRGSIQYHFDGIYDGDKFHFAEKLVKPHEEQLLCWDCLALLWAMIETFCHQSDAPMLAQGLQTLLQEWENTDGSQS